MYLKSIGAALIIAGCGGFGLKLAADHRKEERTLRQLIAALDYMECELQYRLTALPELCRQAARECGGALRDFFAALARELDDRLSPDAESCMRAALGKAQGLPPSARTCLRVLGSSLGRFDLPGQLKGLDAARAACRRSLAALSENRDVRLRSYQTLSLCAGAALAILLL